MGRKRKTKTRARVHRAAINILMNKTDRRFNIVNVCELADVNRTTFYSYYKDIDILLMDIRNEYVNVNMSFLYEYNEESKDKFRYFLQEVKEDPINSLDLLRKINALDEVYTRAHKAFLKYIEEGTGELPDSIKTYVEDELTFLLYGFAYVVSKWSESGALAPIDEIIEFFYDKVRQAYDNVLKRKEACNEE